MLYFQRQFSFLLSSDTSLIFCPLFSHHLFILLGEVNSMECIESLKKNHLNRTSGKKKSLFFFFNSISIWEISVGYKQAF